MAWTAPRTWVAGETVTANLLNVHLRDNLKVFADPWTAYTPTWEGTTTNPTLGNGSKVGAYIEVGKLILFRLRITFGSTTNAGSGVYLFGLPVAASALRYGVGEAVAFDTSGNAYEAAPAFVQNTSTQVRVKVHGQAAWAAAVPFTWAAGDDISVTGQYEAA